MWKQIKSVLCLPGIEMRTRQRLDSNNIGASYQFINSSLVLLFSMQIFGVFPPFSLDLCPGKQKKKERIHGQSGKKVSQPPSCFQQHQLWDWEGIQLWLLGRFHAQSASCHLVAVTEKRPRSWQLLVGGHRTVPACSRSLTCQQALHTLNQARPAVLAFTSGNCVGLVDRQSRERWIQSEYILSSSADENRNRKWVSQDCLGK